MERLTYFDGGKWWLKIGDTEYSGGVVDRLAAYEDKGLEPECDFCTEDKDGYVKKMGAFSISEPFHKGEYYLRTKHCKPRKINFCPMCGRKLGGTVFLTREEAEAALRREQDEA